MKKLINDPHDVVRECLTGYSLAHQDLIGVHFDPTYVYRIDGPVRGKVSIISGGGSGHEPMHVGFVGIGMLDAACPGEIFTSPTPDQMLYAARRVNGGAGICYIVKNYSGDVMNFEMAADLARDEGIDVRSILIDDDVSVKNSHATQGRRGMGTTILAEKIAGAAANQGYDVRRVAGVCTKVSLNGRSMGMALTSCIVPTNQTPTFELGEDEIEIGIGIHGERGCERLKMESADEIAETLTRAIIEDQPYKRKVREWDEADGHWRETELTSPPLHGGDSVLAFVNGMGGTPISELYIVYRKVAQICKENGLKIVRSLVGSYVTALEMQGVSVTILKMDEELLRLWDAPVKTPNFRWCM
jgi:dihydroxyacetone kinase-like protein